MSTRSGGWVSHGVSGEDSTTTPPRGNQVEQIQSVGDEMHKPAPMVNLHHAIKLSLSGGQHLAQNDHIV